MLPPIGLSWRNGLWVMAYIIMGIIIATLVVVVLTQHFNLKDANKLVNSMEDEIYSLKNTLTDLKTDIVMLHIDKVKKRLKGTKYEIPLDLDDVEKNIDFNHVFSEKLK